MVQLTEAQFDAAVQRMEVTLSPDDRQKVKALWERYRERLAMLHAADVGDEEVAGLFVPAGEGARR